MARRTPIAIVIRESCLKSRAHFVFPLIRLLGKVSLDGEPYLIRSDLAKDFPSSGGRRAPAASSTVVHLILHGVITLHSFDHSPQHAHVVADDGLNLSVGFKGEISEHLLQTLGYIVRIGISDLRLGGRSRRCQPYVRYEGRCRGQFRSRYRVYTQL